MSSVFPPGVRCGFLDFITDGVTTPKQPTVKSAPAAKGVTKKRTYKDKELTLSREELLVVRDALGAQLRLMERDRASNERFMSRARFDKTGRDIRVLEELLKRV